MRLSARSRSRLAVFICWHLEIPSVPCQGYSDDGNDCNGRSCHRPPNQLVHCVLIPLFVGIGRWFVARSRKQDKCAKNAGQYPRYDGGPGGSANESYATGDKPYAECEVRWNEKTQVSRLTAASSCRKDLHWFVLTAACTKLSINANQNRLALQRITPPAPRPWESETAIPPRNPR